MTEFDPHKYELHLAQAREERGIDLSPIRFDPQEHPRDAKGRFREVVADLRSGNEVRLPDDTSVRYENGEFRITQQGRTTTHPNPVAAADKAFNISSAKGTESRPRAKPRPAEGVVISRNPGYTPPPRPRPVYRGLNPRPTRLIDISSGRAIDPFVDRPGTRVIATLEGGRKVYGVYVAEDEEDVITVRTPGGKKVRLAREHVRIEI